MLTGKYRKGETGRAEAFGGKVFQAESSHQRSATLDAVLAIAADLRVSPDQVAIAWVAARGGLPTIGPRSLDQLTSNLGAGALTLSAEQLERLDEVSLVQSQTTEPAASLDITGLEPVAVSVA